MNQVEKFIRENTHQLGNIMHVAATVWAEKDPVGALTVGPCKFYIDNFGDYHTLLDAIGKIQNDLKQFEPKPKKEESKGPTISEPYYATGQPDNRVRLQGEW